MPKSYDYHFRYLHTHNRSPRYPVNVLGAGRCIIHADAEYPPPGHPRMYQFDWHQGRRLPEFQVLLLTEGGGEFESEATGLRRFRGPTLMVLFPGIWHRYRPLRNCGWVERWLSFNGEIAYNVFDFRVSAAQFALTSLVDARPLVERFDDMYDNLQSATSESSELLAFKAFRVITDSALLRQQAIHEHALTLKMQAPQPAVSDPVVRKALEIIWSRDGKSSESVGEIARCLSVRRRTLDKRFADVLGYSVLTEIRNCRMSRAKRLLPTTDLPIKQVAYLAGYPSSERMRVAFQQMEEMNPLDFRRKSEDAGRRSTSDTCNGQRPTHIHGWEAPYGHLI